MRPVRAARQDRSQPPAYIVPPKAIVDIKDAPHRCPPLSPSVRLAMVIALMPRASMRRSVKDATVLRLDGLRIIQE